MTNVIEFTTKSANTELLATKIVVGILYKKSANDTVQIMVCNNGNDASPTWEDCTAAWMDGIEYVFKNKTKTATSAAIRMKVIIKR